MDATGVYVGGHCSGSLVPGVNGGVFVRKYNFDGAEQWTRQFVPANGSAGAIDAAALSVHGGVVWISGMVRSAEMPGHTAAGQVDAFVRVFDSNGEVLATDQLGGAEDDEVRDIAAGPNGVYMCGMTEGSMPGQMQIYQHGDPFVLRYGPLGRPPVITCKSPVALWSTNHELVDVSAAFSVSDPDGDPVTLSFRVFSDETEIPDTGDGTGRHAPDFKGELLDGRGLLLRSERRGAEDGRFYVGVITADDGNGGVTTQVCVLAACPHDQTDESLDDVLAQANAAAEAIQDAVDNDALPPSPEAPSGLYEHGISDPLGPHQ